MFRICWNRITIWTSKYFELHFHISFFILSYHKICYQAKGYLFFSTLSPPPHMSSSAFGPLLPQKKLIVTFSSNRLLRPGWSIKIIHKNVVILNINIHYWQKNFLCLVCTGYIFHQAICQLRHRGSYINKHNKNQSLCFKKDITRTY